MKHTFAKLFESAKGLSKRKKTALGSAIIVVLAAPVSVFALTRPAEQPMQVKNGNGGVRTKNTEKKAPAEAAINNQTSQTNQPSTNQTEPATAPIQKPSQQSAPNPTPNRGAPLPPLPRIAPAFIIRISYWSVTNFGPSVFQVPFATAHDQGHTSPITTATANVIPAAGITCTPILIGQDYGELRVFIPDTAPNGQYTCQATFGDGTITRTAQFSFTVTDTSYSIP